MGKPWGFPAAVLLAAMAVAMGGSATAREPPVPDGIDVSADTCTAAFHLQWRGYFRTPESDGRPGYKFYALGVWALCRQDYAHAVDLFKTAGSWGYKPAEYSLGVMNFRGAGVPVNRPRGTAWMELAAASGIPEYVKVRDVMLKLLSAEEIAQMQEWHKRLAPTWGAASLRRARWQWKLASETMTGSHLGHPVGPLLSATGWPLLAYYRVLRQSDDPYPDLDKFLTGGVTVGRLQPLDTYGNGEVGPAAASSQQPPSGSQQQFP